jgi:hypothetical protein
MSKDTLKQYSVYGLTILIALLVLYVIKPITNYEPSGIILPTTEALPPQSNQAVTVYQYAPDNAKPLAKINVEMHSLNPNEQQEQQILEYAVTLAKKAGANGLVISTFGYEGSDSSNPAPLAKYVLYGEAITTN